MTARVLYLCDFFPLNSGGGAVLMERLLKEYPEECLTVAAGSGHLRRAAGQKPGKNYIVLPTFSARGRWGIGRLRSLLDWLALPFIALVAVFLIRRKRIQVMLSVAHGEIFLAAALAARVTRIPLVLWVHDDWVALAHSRTRSLLKYFAPRLLSFAVRSARHVYAISTPMAEWLQSAYGVQAEVQLPCSEEFPPAGRGTQRARDIFRIAFAGTNTGTGDTVGLLAGLVAAGASLPDGRPIELHLYMPASGFRPEWRHENVVLHSWVSQPELQAGLEDADLLFLPYNFSEHYAYLWTRSFPTKAADYLRYGKPILVMAPASAAIVPYARAERFAELVDTANPDALRDAIHRVASDPALATELSTRAADAFERNHNARKQRQDVYRLIERLSVPSEGSPRVAHGKFLMRSLREDSGAVAADRH